MMFKKEADYEPEEFDYTYKMIKTKAQRFLPKVFSSIFENVPADKKAQRAAVKELESLKPQQPTAAEASDDARAQQVLGEFKSDDPLYRTLRHRVPPWCLTNALQYFMHAHINPMHLHVHAHVHVHKLLVLCIQ
jgi:hypothetical protein